MKNWAHQKLITTNSKEIENLQAFLTYQVWKQEDWGKEENVLSIQTGPYGDTQKESPEQGKSDSITEE